MWQRLPPTPQISSLIPWRKKTLHAYTQHTFFILIYKRTSTLLKSSKECQRIWLKSGQWLQIPSRFDADSPFCIGVVLSKVNKKRNRGFETVTLFANGLNFRENLSHILKAPSVYARYTHSLHLIQKSEVPKEFLRF